MKVDSAWLALALIKEIQEFLYGAARPPSPLKRRAKPAYAEMKR